jgi:hypothetical protein
MDGGFVTERDRAPLRASYDPVRGGGQTVGQTHVPNMVLVDPNTSFAREKVERCDLEITYARHRPDVRRPSLAIERGALRTIGKVIANTRDIEATIASPGEGFRYCRKSRVG